ncbi:unnamed protein product [Prorocentrum cordatum]|uniref:Uncharacterized protein n=1 Tax=Prorocentrum cordatum TaxID=2364126 RepID=A0ABN9XQY5_9DINO|nr:unnamed protein product [Polarella glacialis]
MDSRWGKQCQTEVSCSLLHCTGDHVAFNWLPKVTLAAQSGTAVTEGHRGHGAQNARRVAHVERCDQEDPAVGAPPEFRQPDQPRATFLQRGDRGKIVLDYQPPADRKFDPSSAAPAACIPEWAQVYLASTALTHECAHVTRDVGPVVTPASAARGWANTLRNHRCAPAFIGAANPRWKREAHSSGSDDLQGNFRRNQTAPIASDPARHWSAPPTRLLCHCAATRRKTNRGETERGALIAALPRERTGNMAKELANSQQARRILATQVHKRALIRDSEGMATNSRTYCKQKYELRDFMLRAAEENSSCFESSETLQLLGQRADVLGASAFRAMRQSCLRAPQLQAGASDTSCAAH